jgi:Family of unknown function (DUF5360)
MSKPLGLLLLATDVGLLTYWLVTALATARAVRLPPEWLFSDYHNPVIVAWNWSFLPLDIVLSITGLTSVRLAAHQDDRWQRYAVISLSLTVCAGLMAISFWAIRLEFDLVWWGFNLYLLLWPLLFLLSGDKLRCGIGNQSDASRC